ncbi:MAG: serine hydrolase [Isosphaeraceae bacterium]
MKRLAPLAMVVLISPLALAADLPRSSPEEQGVPSPAIQEFIEAADRDIDALHSFMLIRHGHVVAEGWWTPYEPGLRHSLFSLSKSFTSTGIGLAIAEGMLSLDDPVLKFFPEDAPEKPSDNLKAMRVSDLLRMNTGHQTEPSLRETKERWTKVFLNHPVPFKPGTHFLYNTPATYMLSAIVQKATGQTLLEYLRPRLFEPLGIENPTWDTSPQGVSLGGYGLSVRTEDIAKFGQLYLQKGQWQGKQLVPAAWVEAATARQTSNGSNPKSDWDQGYGYQFWRARHGAYRGDGAFGQYCLVMPEQDAVIAITSGLKDMQAVLNLVWDKLLPAMKSGSLPTDEEARRKLQSTLKGLALRPEQGTSAPARFAGKTYKFPSNDRKLESVRLEGGERGETLVLRFDGKDREIPCGRGEWRKSRQALGPFPEQSAAASGAWKGDDTYSARIALTESPFILRFSLRFLGDELQLDTDMNVGFGPTHMPRLVGRAE